MSEIEKKKLRKKGPLKRTLKVAKNKAGKGGGAKLKKIPPVDPKNRNPQTILNTTGLDTDKLGNIGKFVKMDDDELDSFVPKNGKGHGNTLTDDERDSRLVLVNRMNMRGFTNDEIADKLGVSTRMVTTLKNQVKDMHRRSFTNVDINEWMGGTMAFFDEIRNTALQVSSVNNNSTRDKLHALKVAIDSEMNKNRFLDYCGVFGYIRQNQHMVSDVIEHRGGSEKSIDEIQTAMDDFAIELFQSM